MTSTPWNTSPVAETVSELLELSDGLEIDGGVLKTIGDSHSFEDDFSTFNTTNFPLSINAIVSSGKLQFTQGSGTGFAKRYAAFQRSTVADFLGTTIEVLEIDPSGSFYISLASSLTSYNPGIMFYDLNSTQTNMYHNGASYKSFTHSGNLFDIKLVINYDGITDVYMRETGNDWELFAQLQIAKNNLPNFFWIQQYADNDPLSVGGVNVYSYPTEATAELPETEAYSVQSPAKFAYAQSVTPNFPSLGAGGEIQFYAQHLNDWLPEWASLDDAFCDWTLVGTLSHGVALEFPEYITAPNEQLRYKLVYTGTGIVSYPTLDELEFAWISDVEAPSAPTVTIATQAGDSGATLQVNDTIPDGAYGCEVEVNINNAGYLPLSRRAELETGYDYLIFRGSISAEQLKGEINSLLWNVGGLAVSNTIQIKSRMVDNLLNRSAFTESDALIITAEALPPVNIPGVTTQSYAEEYAQIAKLLKDAWLEGDPASEITPILWDGVSADYPTDANGDRVNFIKMFITSGESDQISIGTPDRNIFRYSQMLVVKIYTLSQLGAIPALTLGDTFCSIFRNRNDAGIVFKSPRTISMGVNEDGYYQVNCFCPFDRDSFF